MMAFDDKTQKQSSGNGSMNIQAGGAVTIVNARMTVEDVKAIALEVFKANVMTLADIAKEAALRRAEEMTDQFLGQLKEVNPKALDKAGSPDFQMALFDAQKAYARTGDAKLAQLLVDLLVNRTEHETRSIQEIVLTESLSVASRLTAQQISTVTLLFILRYTMNTGIESMDGFVHWFRTTVSPFVPSLTKSATCYQHLAYSGVATIEITSTQLWDIWRQTYPGVFSQGLPKTEYQSYIQNHPALDSLLVPARHNPANVQLIPYVKSKVQPQLAAIGIPANVQDELWKKHVGACQSTPEIHNNLEEQIDTYSHLMRTWNESQLQSTFLTSVGMAIGHANFQRVTGQRASLSIWVHD